MDNRENAGYVKLDSGEARGDDAGAAHSTVDARSGADALGPAGNPPQLAASLAPVGAGGAAAQRFGLRRTSPGPLREGVGVGGAAPIRKRHPAAIRAPAPPPPGQPLVLRQKDKTVLLPVLTAHGSGDDDEGVAPTIFEDLDDGSIGSKGRVTIYCICEALRRKELEELVSKHYVGCRLTRYPDALHVELPCDLQLGPKTKWSQDVFLFDYGVVCTWGLSQMREQEFVSLAKRCAEEPLPIEEVEIDQFSFVYSVHEPPSMSNDSITINRRQAADHQVKLAICHALAQSTKLCVYEERVVDLVNRTKHLPQEMAEHGTVRVSAKEVAQLIGQVFLQRSAVNLLSSVLDTPEFFWSAPDAMQVLYERACEYLELETRVEVLNARFEVLQDMLDMLRDYVAHQHSSTLEWIIIILIGVELIVGLVQLAGLFGVIATAPHAGGG